MSLADQPVSVGSGLARSSTLWFGVAQNTWEMEHGELEAQNVRNVAMAEAVDQRNEAQVERLLFKGVQNQVQHSVGLQIEPSHDRKDILDEWTYQCGLLGRRGVRTVWHFIAQHHIELGKPFCFLPQQVVLLLLEEQVRVDLDQASLVSCVVLQQRGGSEQVELQSCLQNGHIHQSTGRHVLHQVGEKLPFGCFCGGIRLSTPKPQNIRD
mmetsp:Transcript_21833/g.37703  ORF Transcript_21833/g.37703 Transcript_21833/m.37703 type:complete len:210 (-) Transcript_21833:351-980(-)